MKPKTKGRIFVSEIRECLSEKERDKLIDKKFDEWWINEKRKLTWSQAFKAGFLAGSQSVELNFKRIQIWK